MDAAELAQLIEELETRVERLRAVYEQYFMGIERLEPLIQRKDVDRRLWILRKEQIRNTGMRFKLQTTIQRYNTYQQYWARIVREIENGTYQRDLGRAAARFGENAVTAFGKRRQKMFQKGLARKAERDAARKGETSSAPPPPDSGDQASDSFDVAFEDSEIFAEAIAPARVPLELDMNFDASAGPAPPAARRASTPPRGSPAMVPPGDVPTPRHGSFPPPPLASPAARPVAPARSPAPKPPAPRAPQPAGSPAASGALPPVQAPPGRAPAPRAPAAPPVQAKGPTTRATPPAGTQLPPEGELSPTRIRQIYGQYVDAKRKANESTAAITYDKIAANLRETAKQLKTKHKGRDIDFEVVMRNGKPVLKPVLKG